MTDHENKGILIVDDEPQVCSMLARILEKEGYSCKTSNSAKEALDLLAEGDFALLLLDIQMPEMSGLELQKKVRRKCPDIAVVMVSGVNDRNVVFEVLRNGAYGYIIKPIEQMEVVINVKNALRRRTLEIENREYQVELERLVFERTQELQKAYKDLQSSQEQIIQQEKMAAVGQLAAGVAHEINNPIGYVSSNLNALARYSTRLIDFLQAQRELCASFNDSRSECMVATRKLQKEKKIDFLSEDLTDIVRESQEGVERIKNIVQGLKNFSRKDQDQPLAADINECLETTLNVIWNELKYKTTVVKDYGQLPTTKCYPQQLSQVFMNLLVNAAQAIETKGEITITTRHRGDAISVAITDTGSGIAADKIQKIFEPFFTTKPVGQGTGLGLSIVREILDKHNGTIDIASEPGKGSCFTVTVPVMA